MKITDYGLWFKELEQDEFTKIPKEIANVYFNGKDVGFYYCNIYVRLEQLVDIGFKINPESPGEKYGIYWKFPEKYIPTESDFLELP